MFLLNIRLLDGTPITLIEECQNLLNVPKFRDNCHILVQHEHPILRKPFMTFHPCKTAEIMESFAKQS